MKMQRRREEAYDQASDRGGERYNKRTRGNTGYNPYYNYDPSYHHYPRRENVYYHDYHDHGPVQHPAAVQQPMMASSRTVVEPMCYPAQPQQQVRQVVNDDAISKKGKRLCRTPGCIRVIKSQGHCQRHGAKVKRCKVEGCQKQAQGTHDGMCKRHWTELSSRQETQQAEEAIDLKSPASTSSSPGSLYIW